MKKDCVENIQHTTIKDPFFTVLDCKMGSKVVPMVNVDILTGKRTEYYAKFILKLEPCKFGGLRKWFICPNCGSKRMKLYFCYPDSQHPICRECLNLTYKSRQRRKGGQFARILNKILKKEEKRS